MVITVVAIWAVAAFLVLALFHHSVRSQRNRGRQFSRATEGLSTTPSTEERIIADGVARQDMNEAEQEPRSRTAQADSEPELTDRDRVHSS